MRHPRALRPALLVLALGLGLIAPPGWAEEDCEAPLQRWQSREAVRQMALARGWQIQRLKIDDGCYEIRGTDAQGRGFKARIDPETLKVLKMKPAEPRRERGREHDHDRDRPPAAAPGAASTPDAAPRGQIL